MEFIFSAPDGSRLAARSWEPPEIKAILLVIHGFGEYGAKYVSLVPEMHKQGVAVCAMDLRGFGVSDGRRGHASSMDILMKDLDAFVATATRYYDVPMFMMGHSMGGTLAAHWAFRNPRAIAGLILSSPWIGSRYQPGVVQRSFLTLAAVLWPSRTFRFDINKVETGKTTRPLTAYADRRVHQKVSAGLIQILKKAARQLNSGEIKLEIPLLALHGGQDRITDPRATERFTRLNRGQFRLWPEDGHTLHRGTTRKEFCAEVNGWIEQALENREGCNTRHKEWTE